MRDLTQEIDFDFVFDKSDQLDRAIAVAAHNAVKRHKALNQPIVVWHDDKPTIVPAAEIDLTQWSSPPVFPLD